MTTIKEKAEEYAKSCHNPMNAYYDIKCENTKKDFIFGCRMGLELALEKIRHWQKKRPGLGIVRHEIEQILAEKEE